MIKRANLILLLSLGFMSGAACSLPGRPENPSRLVAVSGLSYSISGQVQFPQRIRTQAVTEDIRAYATVSLLNPNDHATTPHRTVATGLSDANGVFSLTPGTAFSPANGEIFVLEAARRLGAAGNEALSLRSYLRWNGSGWDSISAPGIVINSRTTALTLMDGLDTRLSASDTFGKVTLAPEGFSEPLGTLPAGTAEQVTGLLNSLLAQDRDPIAYLMLAGSQYQLTAPLNPQLGALRALKYCPDCQLKGADLANANLTGALLSNTNLSQAQLQGSNLSQANLSNAQLTGANLQNSNLSQAVVSGVNWAGVQLGGATWINDQTCQAGSIAACSYEIRVNTHQGSGQDHSRIAMHSDGNWIVIWDSNAQDGSGLGVYAQRFDRYGNKIGDEFRVNDVTAGDQIPSEVIFSPQGKFAIFWSDNGAGLNKMKVYNPDGSELSGEVTMPAGSRVFGADETVWLARVTNIGPSLYDIYLQQYALDGSTLNTAVRVNTAATSNATTPSLALNAAGQAAVAFIHSNGANDDVYIRTFSAGNPVSGAVRVNQTTADVQHKPKVTLRANGEAALVWQSQGQDGSGYGVYARIVNPNGTFKAPEFRVNDFMTFDQYEPVIASSATRIAITWQSLFQTPPSLHSVISRTYDWDGQPLSLERQLNFTNGQNHNAPALAMNADNLMAASWTDIDSSLAGVTASLYGF